MEKLVNFFKTKTIGYYIVAAITLFALVVAIIFFTNYSTPSVAATMGNKAVGLAPETIGIFLVAAIVTEIVVLLMPEYRFFHIVAVLMFGLALYKDVIIIADFIAGLVNGVMYNDGNVGLNMFFFIALLIISILAVACAFLGFVKENKEEEVKENE